MMDRLRSFMAGRRGADQLSLALMVFGVVLTFISSIVSWFAMHPAAFAAYVVLHLLSIVFFLLAILRMFSKNLAARNSENMRFLSMWQRVTAPFKRDRKHFIYLRCPSCKAQLRVPKGKGNIIVTCPKCKHETKIKS